MGEQSVLETQWYISHKVVASGLHELRACVLYIYLLLCRVSHGIPTWAASITALLWASGTILAL